MIPRPFIAKWRDHAPWNSFSQIEMDLIVCRTLIELFSDDLIRNNLALRGGVALHKLYLSPSPRYVDTIELVQIRKGVKFHNGKEMTAEDIRQNIDWKLNR